MWYWVRKAIAFQHCGRSVIRPSPEPSLLPAARRQFPPPALVCHMPRPLTISKAPGWARTAFVSVFPVLGRPERDTGVHVHSPECRVREESVVLGFKLAFIGAYCFLTGLYWVLLGF